MFCFVLTLSVSAENASLNYVHNGTAWIPWLATSDGKPKVDLNLLNITAGDLTVSGNATASYFKGDGSELTGISASDNVSLNYGYNGSEWLGLKTTSGGILKIEVNGINYLSNKGDSTTGNYSFDSGTLFIDSSSNRVGIGTTSPTAPLHISSTGQYMFDLERKGGVSDGKWRAHITHGNGGGVGTLNFQPTVSTSDFNVLDSSGTSRFIVDTSSGNVGIGTTTPGSYKLYVAGNAYTTGSWGGSDARWKKNITLLQNSLSKVLELEGVNYNWRVDEFPNMSFDNDTHIGLIAQELELVIPELVKTNDDGYKSIAYDKLTVVLVEAVKELKQENDELKQRLEMLENKQIPHEYLADPKNVTNP